MKVTCKKKKQKVFNDDKWEAVTKELELRKRCPEKTKNRFAIVDKKIDEKWQEIVKDSSWLRSSDSKSCNSGDDSSAPLLSFENKSKEVKSSLAVKNDDDIKCFQRHSLHEAALNTKKGNDKSKCKQRSVSMKRVQIEPEKNMNDSSESYETILFKRMFGQFREVVKSEEDTKKEIKIKQFEKIKTSR